MSAEYLQHVSELMSSGEEINGRALQAQQAAVHTAAYDPAFFLPFTLQVRPHTPELKIAAGYGSGPQGFHNARGIVRACVSFLHSGGICQQLHCAQVIREELLSCLEVATSGLLAVVVRGLACGSAAFRSCSYEALALYNEALEQSNFR